MNRLKDFFLKLKTSDWLTFAVVSALIFAKNLLFHYSCFGYLAFSSLWTAPVDFFAFYFAKLSPAVFIASFCFLFKRKWWICLVSLLLDLWLMANMIYFRANGFFLDIDTIAMAGNMDGFWNSVWAYINWTIFAVLLTTIILCVYCLFAKKVNCVNKAVRSWQSFVIGMAFVAVLGFYDWFLGAKNSKETHIGADDGWRYNFVTAVNQTESGNNQMMNYVLTQWVECQSPMHFFPAVLYSYFYRLYYHGSNDFSLDEDDVTELQKYIKERKNIVPLGNLIIIIGESFESWTIDLNDEQGNSVVPILSKLSKQNKVLYCDKIKSQVKRGSSGDGQMIINTGLLPLSSGAACMAYDDNVYPNFAENYIYNLLVELNLKIIIHKSCTYR